VSRSIRVTPLGQPPHATVELPGSKSITNRAVLCASLAEGTSTLSRLLLADDTEAMLGCVGALGAGLSLDRQKHELLVEGIGGVLPPGPIELDARSSGTTARFLLPVAAIGPGPYHLDGTAQLRARPMAGALAALRAAGLEVSDAGRGHLPVTVRGSWRSSVPVSVAGGVSSQFLSGVLLAAPCFAIDSTFTVAGELVSTPYVEMTLAVMDAFGAEVSRPTTDRFEVSATGYRRTTYAVEPDASAASYFFAAAAITGGTVRVEGLSRSSLQGDLAFVDVLAEMGADVRWSDDAVEVSGTGRLRGIVADLRGFSDTAQTLAVTAVFADSPTEITGIGFIRHKETDRIAAVVTELRRAGVDASETADGLVVRPGRPRPATIATYDDHRMAMSFALLGLRDEGIEIADPGCVAKTFPEYFTVLDGLRHASR
jgi:3-phosphoshikimate 1-carboxyvinyltransferase